MESTRLGLCSIVSIYSCRYVCKKIIFLFKIFIKINNYLFLFSAFCLVDEQKTCIVVTVYNLAKGRGVTVGDSVGIPEPFVIHQKFSYMNNVSIVRTFSQIGFYRIYINIFFLYF